MFYGLLLFVRHVLGSKASASHIELYRLIPEGKTSGCKVRP